MLQLLGKTTALDQFHCEVVVALMLADLVDGNDVGMIHQSGGGRFLAKALHFRRRGELPAEDHLQCDKAIEAFLPGSVDDAHAASGNLFEDLVIAERKQGRWWQARESGLAGGLMVIGHRGRFAPGFAEHRGYLLPLRHQADAQAREPGKETGIRALSLLTPGKRSLG
jgi:hypothetical protein